MRKTIVLSTILLSLATNLGAASRNRQWKAVAKAMNQDRPKTAIQHLDKIIPAALTEQAHAEAIKAICQKVALEGRIQGDKAEEKITRLQAEIDKAPQAMIPVMQTILAH